MRNWNILGVLGVIVGVIGVAGPILWDYYKTKSEIQISMLEYSRVIEKSRGLPGLSIIYKGEAVNELSSATFSLTNTGRTPILSKDVVSPIYIKLPEDARPIEAKLLGGKFGDLNASVTLDKDNNKVTISFPLLNPGDTINFAVLMQSSDHSFETGARIAGISLINIPYTPPKLVTPTPFTSYLVGLVSVFLGLIGLFIALDILPERRMRKLFKSGSFGLLDLKSKTDVISYINSQFKFTTKKERRSVLALVESYPDSEDIVTLHRDAIVNELKNTVESATPNLPVSLFFFVIAGLGIWYVFS